VPIEGSSEKVNKIKFWREKIEENSSGDKHFKIIKRYCIYLLEKISCSGLFH
jgi:hypothetical protein